MYEGSDKMRYTRETAVFHFLHTVHSVQMPEGTMLFLPILGS